MSGLDGRVVIITGASSGLGETFARALHARGALLVLGARRTDRLERLAATLDGVAIVACDVTDSDDRLHIMDTAVERFGRLDGLVNNAGVTRPGRAVLETVEDFRLQCETNLVAPFALAQLAVPRMRAHGGGSIVNIASIMGMMSIDRVPEAGYNASKAGVIGLTRELASQWGRHGIRVNAIAPGFFPSEMTEEIVGEGAPVWMDEMTPLGRIGDPEELVGTLVHLLSDESSYVTGQTLVVDGGMTTR